jgi:hypothetical protein
MFSYVMLGTNDLQRAIRFYDPLMELLGHPKAGRNEEGASWGTFSNNHTIGLCVGRPFNQQPAGVGSRTMRSGTKRLLGETNLLATPSAFLTSPTRFFR